MRHYHKGTDTDKKKNYKRKKNPSLLDQWLPSSTHNHTTQNDHTSFLSLSTISKSIIFLFNQMKFERRERSVHITWLIHVCLRHVHVTATISIEYLCTEPIMFKTKKLSRLLFWVRLCFVRCILKRYYLK